MNIKDIRKTERTDIKDYWMKEFAKIMRESVERCSLRVAEIRLSSEQKEVLDNMFKRLKK